MEDPPAPPPNVRAGLAEPAIPVIPVEGNLTQQEKLVRRLPEPSPYPDHYLLIFKRSGKEWKLLASRGPGEAYKKPFLISPDSLEAFIVPSDQYLRFRFGNTYKTHDQLHSFTLRLILEYRVSDPVSLVQKREQDPLRRVVEEIDSFLQQRIKSLDWTAVEFEKIDLEQVLFRDHEVVQGHEVVSGFTKLQRFADLRGLRIQRIAVVRELPDTEFQVAATALRNSREQQTAVLEHGTEALRQTLSLDLEGQKNAFERRTQVAQGFTDNFVRAIGQATDNIRSLEDIQRAVPKVAAIQGAIASVATGALPGPMPVGAIPGAPAAGLLADSTTATPLAALLGEFTSSVESLACDPGERKELLSFGLHVVAEALRGRDAKIDILETYQSAITGKLSSLLPILSQEQTKLLKRLQDVETLRKKLG